MSATLDPLCCPRCGARVAVPDADEARCASCGEAVTDVLARKLALRLWLPSLGLYVVGLFALMRGIGTTHVALAESALGALPPKTPNEPPGCRACGAPLDVPAGALVARCLHCGADSLTTFDGGTKHALELDRPIGATSVERALQVLSERDGMALGAVILFGGGALLFLALPLWWAFAAHDSWLRSEEGWQIASVSAAIAHLVILAGLAFLNGFGARSLEGGQDEVTSAKGMLFSGALVGAVAVGYFVFRVMEWVALHAG